MLKIGSHVSLGGKDQFLGSVKEMLSYQANALMIYTGAPQNTIRKPLGEMKIEEGKQLLLEHHIPLEHIIVHAPYIVNLGNPSSEKRQFAIDFLTEEVRRSAAIGSKVLVLHPGAHMKDGPLLGIERIAEGVQQIIRNTADLDVVIALEGMAGKGTEVGRNFEELKAIIDLVEEKHRLGVCLDTCHSYDAGYDIKNQLDEVIQHFDEVVGLSYLKVLHINDSKNPFSSHKDRHENIGFGHLGFETIVNVIYHPLLENIVKILETPYVSSLKNDQLSYPPYKYEIEMIKNKQFQPDLLDVIRKDNEQ